MKIYYIFCLIFLILVSACAKPTGYVQRSDYWGDKYGVSHKVISKNEFAIIAEGNAHTSADRVATLALYHAAIITIQNNGKFFRLINRVDESLPTHQTIVVPLPFFPTVIVPVSEYTRNEMTSILIIQTCDVQSGIESKCLDAQQIIEDLESIIKK